MYVFESCTFIGLQPSRFLPPIESCRKNAMIIIIEYFRHDAIGGRKVSRRLQIYECVAFKSMPTSTSTRLEDFDMDKNCPKFTVLPFRLYEDNVSRIRLSIAPDTPITLTMQQRAHGLITSQRSIPNAFSTQIDCQLSSW